jgi:hypothetical protein
MLDFQQSRTIRMALKFSFCKRHAVIILRTEANEEERNQEEAMN